MKAVLLIALLVVPMVLADSNLMFDQFLTQYHKKYTGLEYYRRLQIFEQNLKLIALRNAEEGSGAVHGINQFADLTFDEFSSKYMSAPVPAPLLVKNCLKNGVYQPKPIVPVGDVPDAFDWRNQTGVVHSVKDQGSCGSCWAFSTAQNVEGVWGVHATEVPDLSPQWIVDCSKSCTSEIYGGKNTTVCNQGCNGGWPWSAFYDVINGPTAPVNGSAGLPTLAAYPYKGTASTCKTTNPPAATIAEFACISGPNAADEADMQAQLMAHGPLSIAVDANSFQTYKKGILNPSSCSVQALNHAVLLVGWGVENNVKYWIIKNSWAASWGEAGYVRLIRGVGKCGVNEGVSTACLKADCSY